MLPKDASAVPLQGSLAELNMHLPDALPMQRFRPNIVAAGAAPFAEDAWQSFSIAGTDFEAVKPCSRCKVRFHTEVLKFICRGRSQPVLRQTSRAHAASCADMQGTNYFPI